jgi:hypothetical protein
MAIAAQIKDHMPILGSDGQHVGTVDRVQGDRIKLTRSGACAGGVHHYLNLALVAGIDDGSVLLRCTAAEAHSSWLSYPSSASGDRIKTPEAAGEPDGGQPMTGAGRTPGLAV